MTILLKNVFALSKNISSFHCENIWHRNRPLNSRFRSCNFRNFMAAASNSQNDCMLETETPFTPKKALVLSKFSRYEFEKRRHADLSEDELIKNKTYDDKAACNHQQAACNQQLENRGSDYSNLLQHHQIHTKNRDLVVKTLHDNGVETKVVNRFDYNDSNIEWADVVITTGGDGTFLMAASKIRSKDKPLIGINSDPTRSLGYLCLPSFYTENFPEAMKRLKSGNYRWMHRKRIKVTLTGEHAFAQPVELHDQQLQYPEYRFLDCVEEPQKNAAKVPKLESKLVHELPVRALNEVFIGESLSSRVSYYEFSLDKSAKEKIKSSGLTICTGTGSTSWSFNINKVTEQCVKELLKITSEETKTEIPTTDPQLITQITSRFNNSLIFDPTKSLMAYTIRDPIVFGMGLKNKPRGFAERIEVKSRMFDACLVIDGGLSFPFNDGSTTLLEINDEDALLTVKLPH